MRFALTVILIATTISSACNTPENQEAKAASHEKASGASITMPNQGGLIPGTPEGDLGDWVKDIRRGLDDVADIAKTDVAGAQKKTLDLYVTRQEYAEMYYGVDGRAKATEELAQAIETAEERFHELMKLLGTATPQPSAVVAAIDALDAQQTSVAKLWKKSGAKLDRTSQK